MEQGAVSREQGQRKVREIPEINKRFRFHNTVSSVMQFCAVHGDMGYLFAQLFHARCATCPSGHLLAVSTVR